MTGLERRSAFVPVPPSAANYNSSININADLFKLHHANTEEYSNQSYYNQLPQAVVPSVSIHSYNRTNLPPLPNDESNSLFQQLNNPRSHIETFQHNTPNTQHNKVLVKVSDPTMVMADVKNNRNQGSRSRNKRKQDALSALHRNIMEIRGTLKIKITLYPSMLLTTKTVCLHRMN